MASDSPPDNPLSATSLSTIIKASLPSSADPQLKTPLDAIAIAAHACLISVGFRLVGLGEDHKIDAPSSDAQNTRELPAEWNTHHAFRYKHSQSSMEYLLKLNTMGSKFVVLAMALGDDKTHSFDAPIADFVSRGNLPASPGKNSEQEAYQTIGNVFITIGRLSDFSSMMRLKVIQRLMPSLNKEGYSEDTRDAEREAEETRRRGPRPDRPDYDPLRDSRPRIPDADPLAHPRRPMPDPMPGFDDEHEIMRPPRGVGGFSGPRFGDRDLYPAGLGPNDPLRGGIGPGLSPMGGSGGMHPTFDDPLFTGQGRRPQGYDPQAPPGSRFDPAGPGAGHPRGAGMGGAPPNPFSGFGDGDFI